MVLNPWRELVGDHCHPQNITAEAEAGENLVKGYDIRFTIAFDVTHIATEKRARILWS